MIMYFILGLKSDRNNILYELKLIFLCHRLTSNNLLKVLFSFENIWSKHSC